MNPEIAQYEALAKEILRRCMSDEEPEDLFKFVSEMLIRMGAADDSALLTWEESFDLLDKVIDDYEELAKVPESERKVLLWPWQSWRNLIDPLEAGMLAVITAPDGQGKTIYAESIAEHWARHKNKIVFVHYELNRKLVMMRRTARHASVPVRDMKEGKLTASQRSTIAEIRPRLMAWDGYISYLHTPGWTMEKTVSELRRLVSEGQCEAVVLDYLEKASASKRQLQKFGSNNNQREADNVEQLKNFSELTDVPVVMVAQMNKAGKAGKFADVDRTGMRGAGEKSDKANLVVLLRRERNDAGYSNEVSVLIDKNTMGANGTFKQMMQPEYFRVGDIQNA